MAVCRANGLTIVGESLQPIRDLEATEGKDFMHDRLATGRTAHPNQRDTISRFSPVVDPPFSYHGENVF